jgi:hypothetical protein
LRRRGAAPPDAVRVARAWYDYYFIGMSDVFYVVAGIRLLSGCIFVSNAHKVLLEAFLIQIIPAC